MKHQLKDTPSITVRKCSPDLYVPAMGIAIHCFEEYEEWPHSEAIITDVYGVWIFRVRKTGHVSVTWLGERDE